jgi:hypothetical protein
MFKYDFSFKRIMEWYSNLKEWLYEVYEDGKIQKNIVPLSAGTLGTIAGIWASYEVGSQIIHSNYPQEFFASQFMNSPYSQIIRIPAATISSLLITLGGQVGGLSVGAALPESLKSVHTFISKMLFRKNPSTPLSLEERCGRDDNISITP